MSRQTITCLSAATLVLALSGCASIFNGGTQTVGVQSTPEGATVRVVNRAGDTVHVATTPTRLALTRGAGYFKPESYTFRFAKDGFDPVETPVAGRMSAWYVGNILFGGLIGMVVVDPLTGGMFTFDDAVTATLVARPAVGQSATVSTVSSATLSTDVGASTSVRPAQASIPGGTSAYMVERMPDVAACSKAPRAALTAKGAGFELYSVPCGDGNALAVRCEFGVCRVLR